MPGKLGLSMGPRMWSVDSDMSEFSESVAPMSRVSLTGVKLYIGTGLPLCKGLSGLSEDILKLRGGCIQGSGLQHSSILLLEDIVRNLGCVVVILRTGDVPVLSLLGGVK